MKEFKFKVGDRAWHPFSVGNHQAITYRWQMAQTQVKTRGMKTIMGAMRFCGMSPKMGDR